MQHYYHVSYSWCSEQHSDNILAILNSTRTILYSCYPEQHLANMLVAQYMYSAQCSANILVVPNSNFDNILANPNITRTIFLLSQAALVACCPEQHSSQNSCCRPKQQLGQYSCYPKQTRTIFLIYRTALSQYSCCPKQHSVNVLAVTERAQPIFNSVAILESTQPIFLLSKRAFSQSSCCPV